MTNIERLNKLLGDNLGINRYGEPKYKWVLAGELTFPIKAETTWEEHNGVLTPVPQFEVLPQLPMHDRHQWVISMWMLPPTMSQWRAKYGTEMGYPERGYYMTADVILPKGRKPTENITREVIGAVRTVKGMSEADFQAHNEAATAKAERDHENLLDSFLSDKMTAFGEVPGSRGGSTSFQSGGPVLSEVPTSAVKTNP